MAPPHARDKSAPRVRRRHPAEQARSSPHTILGALQRQAATDRWRELPDYWATSVCAAGPFAWSARWLTAGRGIRSRVSLALPDFPLHALLLGLLFVVPGSRPAPPTPLSDLTGMRDLGADVIARWCPHGALYGQAASLSI